MTWMEAAVITPLAIPVLQALWLATHPRRKAETAAIRSYDVRDGAGELILPATAKRPKMRKRDLTVSHTSEAIDSVRRVLIAQRKRKEELRRDELVDALWKASLRRANKRTARKASKNSGEAVEVKS